MKKKIVASLVIMLIFISSIADMNRNQCIANPENTDANEQEIELNYEDDITMIDLMNHQGGWQETTEELEVTKSEEIIDLEHALKQTEPIQSYRPGTVTSYSNWGAALAAYIVERISKETFVDYVHQHIFQPLKMEHTSIGSDHTDTSWVALQRNQLKSYSLENDTLECIGKQMGYILIYPAGAATGTLEDFVVFAKSLSSVDGTSPLFQKKETLLEMRKATSYYGDLIPRNCHGMWTLQYGVDVYGHSITFILIFVL